MEELPHLTADEWHVLQRYRDIRDAGQGMLVIEFVNHRATKYEWKSAAEVRILNALLGDLPSSS